ncbi:MAG: reverse transcriptase family protein [Pseudomonadota bacterium]
MQHPWDSQQFRTGAKAAGRSQKTIEAAIVIAGNIKKANPDLPVVLTLHHFSHLCDVSAEFLQDVIFRKVEPYRTFRLQKRGYTHAPARQFRTICVPEPRLMQAQRWIAQHILNCVTPHDASYAFARDRDLVKSAMKHAGARWLVKIDVRQFFESISERQVYFVFRSLGYPALLCFQLARICTRLSLKEKPHPRPESGPLPYRRWPQGHLPQGAPTSPMLANLSVRDLDGHLSDMSKQLGWTYTRYADDLAFSRVDDVRRSAAMRLTKLVEQALGTFGLTVRHSKTSIAPPRARKLMLGVLVDRERPRLTRSFRNNLETHLYALTSPKIGVRAHMRRRGFASHIGMQRHVAGLLAFAHQVDSKYAAKQYRLFNAIDWNS